MAAHRSQDHTPMMRQYLRMKQVHPGAVLLFRMGDFYEMFYDDAKLASRLLGLALTSREKGEQAVPMAGVPHHAVDTYIKRLVDAGYKVAVCDQVEDPAKARGLVRRDVTRLITPGTLTEDALLGTADHNFLAAVAPGADGRTGIAWVDLSTGAFRAEDVAADQLAGELSRISPSECLLPESPDAEALRETVRRLIGGMITLRPGWAFGRDTALKTLLDHFRVASLDGFGCAGLGPALCAAGAALQYLQETQKVALRHVRTLTPFSTGDRLLLDRSTQISLELVRTSREGERRGSLLWVLDRTRTPMGARLLRERLLAPLTDVAAIKGRLDAVEAFARDHALREEVRRLLDGIHDIERVAARVSCARANARDLVSLGHSLASVPELRARLAAAKAAPLARLAERIDPCEEVRVLVAAALAPDPPLALTEGGLIRDGYHPELDELRSLRRSGRDWIARFQAEEAERTGIPSLKVGYNRVFGYYIEVTNAHREKVPPEYARRQTLKNAERYITPQLKEHETRVLTADDRARRLEYDLFLEIRGRVAEATERLQALAAAVAEVDVLSNLADVAVEYRYVRPTLTEGRDLHIVDGRHPVLERTLDEPFVPNDIHLDDAKGHMVVITGPNMAGKSTYIRQVALIVVLAQLGSFVPAARAEIGIVDRLFTRVGASDELAQGMSTFMVEMVETANILNNATERSLLVLDEVGRGTSTFDGVSIAWAVAEYIHDRLGSRTLFATHYHELTELGLLYPRIRNFNVAVREWAGEIVFLRKIVEGGTDKSYGIHVARLAGLPKEVIERAKVILQNLESQTLDAENKPKFARPSEADVRRRGGPTARRTVQVQLSLFGADDRLAEALRRLDLSNMTPLQAMQKLEELQREARR